MKYIILFTVLVLMLVNFSACLEKTESKYHHFEIIVQDSTPDFSMAPHHARMSSCYQDKKGTYHLFVDVIDTSLHTLASWQAEVYYYKSDDKNDWQLVEKAVPKGAVNPEKELDYYGVASPAVIASDTMIYLFYAGRYLTEDNVLNCRIFMATAKADKYGAPETAFEKQGVVVDIGAPNSWDDLRLDDPSPVVKDDTLYVYFKGFTEGPMHTRKLGRAVASVKNLEFEKHDEPILALPGGFEMPRVFIYDQQWNLFLRRFEPENDYLWQHFTSSNGLQWQAFDKKFWNKPFPKGGATDMAPVFSLNGKLARPGQVMATGLNEGVMKIWFLDMQIKDSD